jgi:hypothetical protein
MRIRGLGVRGWLVCEGGRVGGEGDGRREILSRR